MSDTTANGKTIIYRGDGLKHVAMAPDVCKTPSPAGPVPVPYPNVAKSSDLARGTKSVTIAGNPAGVASSNIRTSSGDEAGTAGGGLISCKTRGNLKWLRFSLDVKFEGKGVVRFLDDGLHNGNAGNVVGKLSGGTYPGRAPKGEDITCDNCGKSIDSPGHIQLEPSSASDQAAAAVKSNKVTAAVVIKGQPTVFIGKAGDQRSFGVLGQDNFRQLARNFKTGKEIEPTRKTDANRPGNCAEQKALFAAFASGKLPIPVNSSVSLSVVEDVFGGKGKKRYKPSCDTCKRVLASMMCTNGEPQKK